jgi:D-arabinitol 4-dehydrogenase
VLETVSPEGEREYEEITSIQKLLPWQAGQPLINEGANPQTKVIAFTVTEGGYYLNTRHKLETSNPDLQADLAGSAKRFTALSRGFWKSVWRTTPGR